MLLSNELHNYISELKQKCTFWDHFFVERSPQKFYGTEPQGWKEQTLLMNWSMTLNFSPKNNTEESHTAGRKQAIFFSEPWHLFNFSPKNKAEYRTSRNAGINGDPKLPNSENEIQAFLKEASFQLVFLRALGLFPSEILLQSKTFQNFTRLTSQIPCVPGTWFVTPVDWPDCTDLHWFTVIAHTCPWAPDSTTEDDLTELVWLSHCRCQNKIQSSGFLTPSELTNFRFLTNRCQTHDFDALQRAVLLDLIPRSFELLVLLLDFALVLALNSTPVSHGKQYLQRGRANQNKALKPSAPER